MKISKLKNLAWLAGGFGLYKFLSSQQAKPVNKKGVPIIGKIRSMNSLNIFNDRFTGEQEDKIVEVAQNIGVPPDWLVALMGFETGYSFSPKITNSLGYTGLIQFGSAAAKSLGTTTKQLRAMSFLQQMDYVERYFTEGNKHLLSRVNNIEDLYCIMLYPLSLKKSEDWICGSQISLKKAKHIADHNPLFKNKQGYMTRRSVREGLRKHFLKNFPQYYDLLFD